MDFMKLFDQTVREIKREVNLKVLKVPEIEQKVLDATDNEPWGPHGSALSEIAQATKKFTECQMVMNVLWSRLKETDKDWRLVYKALTVIEYLVANGAERAVDDIIDHTFQISVKSLSSFEYVEPNGKDVGLNVRKKAETIVGLLNNKDKIQEARTKAAANRDKYVGHSSTGITYKSSSASSYDSGGFGNSNNYGGFGGTREGSFRDSYKDREKHGEEKTNKNTYRKSHQGATIDSQSKKSTHYGRKGEDNMLSSTAKSSTKYNSSPSQRSSVPTNKFDDDCDDFDPRGTSSTKPADGNSSQVDLFGDFMDAPSLPPAETSAMISNSSEVDLFEDADFVSAAPQVEKTAVDLFASQPTLPSAVSTTVDPFSAHGPVQPETKASTSDPTNTKIVDPFAAVPLNNFDGSDHFGDFTSNSSPVSPKPAINDGNQNNGNQNNLSRKPCADTKPSPKNDTFQVKSGIWADSLTRGLIDLNISAPTKASLVDVGIVGGLSSGSNERDKGPPTSLHMGRAMGAGTGYGLSNSGFPSSQGTTGGDDFFSSLGSQPYQYGGFQK